MTQHKYEIGVRIRTGRLLNSVDHLEKELNHHMKEFGFDEQVYLSSVIPMELTVDLPLDDKAKELTIGVILDTMTKQFGYVELEYFKKV